MHSILQRYEVYVLWYLGFVAAGYEGKYVEYSRVV